MLTAGKKIQERTGHDFSFPMAALAVVFQGGLVMLKAGLAQRASAQADAASAATCRVVGVARKGSTGGATDGLARAEVERGVFLFKNSAAADALTLSDMGAQVFVVDDETVAKTSNSNMRPAAGTVIDVDAAGVWVRVGV